MDEQNDPSGVLGRRLSWVGRNSELFAPHTKEGLEGKRGQDTERSEALKDVCGMVQLAAGLERVREDSNMRPILGW